MVERVADGKMRTCMNEHVYIRQPGKIRQVSRLVRLATRLAAARCLPVQRLQNLASEPVVLTPAPCSPEFVFSGKEPQFRLRAKRRVGDQQVVNLARRLVRERDAQKILQGAIAAA